MWSRIITRGGPKRVGQTRLPVASEFRLNRTVGAVGQRGVTDRDDSPTLHLRSIFTSSSIAFTLPLAHFAWQSVYRRVLLR